MSFNRKMMIFTLTTMSLAAVLAGIQLHKTTAGPITGAKITEKSMPSESSQTQKGQISTQSTGKRSETKTQSSALPSPSQPPQSDNEGTKSTTESQTDSAAPSSANLTLEQFNHLAAQDLAQLILDENAAANQGKTNLVIDTAAKDVALAQTECNFTNQEQKMVHNFIPAPGGQNIAGGTYQAEITSAGAQKLAERLFEGYVSEKTGYQYLLEAGYTPEEIVNGGAQVTVGGVTYSAKGMAGTGFETSSQGGVVSHYAEIANQVPSHMATKFSVSVVYDPQSQFVSTAADFFCGNVQNVYQMNDQGNMGYVTY